jgi:hypothetical protein
MRALWLHAEDLYRSKLKATAFFRAYEPDEKITRRMIDALCVYHARRDSDEERRRTAGGDAKNQLRDLQRACEDLLSSLDKVLSNPFFAEEAQAVGLPAFGIEILNLQGAIAHLSGKPFLNVSRRTQEKLAREKLTASLREAISLSNASHQEQDDFIVEILALIGETMEPKPLTDTVAK